MGRYLYPFIRKASEKCYLSMTGEQSAKWKNKRQIMLSPSIRELSPEAERKQMHSRKAIKRRI